MKLSYPIPYNYITRVTQTFNDHVLRAKKYGWCPGPGNCPDGVYYFGGIDWAIPTGTTITSALSGEVEKVEKSNTGYGVHVRIKSGEYLHIYGHLQSYSVKKGEKVTEGQEIGRSDNTGNSTGPHIHFELRKNGVPIDPMPFFKEDVVTPQPIEFVVPPIPRFPYAEVISDVGLNIRETPAGLTVGFANNGYIFPVIDSTVVNSNVWLQIGFEQWIAGFHDGNVYVKFI